MVWSLPGGGSDHTISLAKGRWTRHDAGVVSWRSSVSDRELGLMDVDALSAAYADRSLSPVDVAAASLRRIAADDGGLGAFVLVDAERALAQARASEARWRAGTAHGPLDGVTASIKDLSLVAGWPTRKGSLTTDDEPAPESSPVVDRLLEAGATVVGKTTTPEFGWKGLCDSPLTGETRNPWDTTRTPGGSSGGSSVAAIMGMATLNVGSDGGGSIRMPSAFCATFGLKATHARVPLWPPGGSGLLSHVGPITRTVRDCAHMMAAIARPDSREIYPTQVDDADWLTGLDGGVAGMRIAFSPRYGSAVVDPQIALAVSSTVSRLAELGAHVDEVDPGHPDCRDAFLVLWDAALGRLLDGLTDERRAGCDPGLVATWERGRVLTAYDFLEADAVRAAATLAFNDLLTRYDLLVSPSVPLLAFPLGSDVADPATQQHWVDWTPFTYPINMTRHPAASVPVGLSRDGLPMAMQIVGRHFDERRVLRAARAVEMAQPFPVLGS
jgi:aspartyl-tRNA(Asn)/glutamyl-tRNA(Gln) amidotransferase subunit A